MGIFTYTMTTVDDTEWRTFCFDSKEDKFDYIEELVKTKTDQYLISHETLDKKGLFKPHFHILYYIGRKASNALVKKVVEDLSLRAKSGSHGGKRKYASLNKNIPQSEINLFLTYLLKEGNYRSNGIDHELLSELQAKSFIKTQQSQYREQLYAHLDEKNIFKDFKNIYETASDEVYNRLKSIIIIFCINNNHQLTYNLKSQIINYLRITPLLEVCAKSHLLTHLIY